MLLPKTTYIIKQREYILKKDRKPMLPWLIPKAGTAIMYSFRLLVLVVLRRKMFCSIVFLVIRIVFIELFSQGKSQLSSLHLIYSNKIFHIWFKIFVFAKRSFKIYLHFWS